jgi:hypothetical protein
MMFTSYWPDPAFFIAYGTDGKSTFAVRGTWAYDFRPFLEKMSGLGVKAVRITHYPTSDNVEVVPPTTANSNAFLPKFMDSKSLEMGPSSGGVPISASLCVTVPHWNAVVRSFQKLLPVNGTAATSAAAVQPGPAMP